MRITSQYLYDNFKQDQQKINQELKKVTEQISSGKKIQNSYDDPTIYNDSLKLDSHINELKGVQDRTQKAKNFTAASDAALQEFANSVRNIKNRLINASNAALNKDNLKTLADELELEKEHMINIANTQIAGQYLFSGSATSIKPIDANGQYNGNGEKIRTVVGEGVVVAQNIDGKTLFLGSDESVNKVVGTNVSLKNFQTDEYIKRTDTIRDMVGDDDEDLTNDTPVTFMLSGTSHNGGSVKNQFTINTGESVETLLTKIGESYGNTATNKNVEVELNDNGNIVITDMQKGTSQLEFKLHATQGTKEIAFINSGYQMAAAGIEDSAYFMKNGSDIEGNVTLIADGAIARSDTKLSDISNGSLDGKSFIMKATDIEGNAKDIVLSLSNGGSTFTIGGTDVYNIYNADGTQTGANEMTMRQLNDIVAMVTSNKLPQSNDKSGFDAAIVASKERVSVEINQSGKMRITDKSNDLSKIEFAMYDSQADDYSVNTPTVSFMSDNAITIQKAQMDIFAELDEIIEAVRNGIVQTDSKSENPRSIGIENSITKIEQFDTHFNNQLAKVGVLDKSLTVAQERSMSMELSIKELKSEITDVDIAEAYMNLNQLSLNYQAILSSVTKINSLSLLNYMK